jgi:hypothetical protein
LQISIVGETGALRENRVRKGNAIPPQSKSTQKLQELHQERQVRPGFDKSERDQLVAAGSTKRN